MENHLALETTGLSHHFHYGEAVLNDINLKIPTGSIYGFLGPNGAGKSTTLRLVLGLLKKQQGVIKVFGKLFDKNRIISLQKIGAMIESPSLYAHLTATENLRVLQKIYQCPVERISLVLEMVGLGGTGDKKAASFSMGMKQRLSIAIALLHEPSLLILDEPTNGLDPNGMIEIRDLLLKLNGERGITIVISSHLLGEIEKMVSHIGIINEGSLLFQGTLEELQRERTTGAFLKLNTSNNSTALDILHMRHSESKIENDMIRLPMLDRQDVATILKELIESGIEIYELSPEKHNLETIFMEMITK